VMVLLMQSYNQLMKLGEEAEKYMDTNDSEKMELVQVGLEEWSKTMACLDEHEYFREFLGIICGDFVDASSPVYIDPNMGNDLLHATMDRPSPHPIERATNTQEYVRSYLSSVWTVMGRPNVSKPSDHDRDDNETSSDDSTCESNNPSRFSRDAHNENQSWSVFSNLRHLSHSIITDVRKSFVDYWDEVRQTVEVHLARNKHNGHT
ncbi:hypothetical protein RFI_36946, partial [Reticulomyxa filosa]